MTIIEGHDENMKLTVETQIETPDRVLNLSIALSSGLLREAQSDDRIVEYIADHFARLARHAIRTLISPSDHGEPPEGEINWRQHGF